MQKLISLILNSKLLLPFAILCTLLVCYLSLSDISSLPKLKVQYEDKLYHLVAYFLLNTVWLLAMIPYSSRSLKHYILISLGIIGFGIVIEVLQDIMTDYRTFDVYDIIANSSGVIISYFTFQLFKKRFFENINSN